MAPPRLSALLGGAVLTPRDGGTCPSVAGRVMVRIDVRALSCPSRTRNTSNASNASSTRALKYLERPLRAGP
ncbi:hypothetical protein M8Z33_02755 [Streptomyces sp. ZAF1911]|uniref:hypothetical protein n=1 Tax=Streptomyces sp. ZAF1911 TaxID=2944129 RepID=UPI00237AFCD0|nr:hypothetical protein [Streptomyces sp. ZAF1911]MDD9375609.1 hypothetical protein [Streptomyces sp. ZAF1911]